MITLLPGVHHLNRTLSVADLDRELVVDPRGVSCAGRWV